MAACAILTARGRALLGDLKMTIVTDIARCLIDAGMAFGGGSRKSAIEIASQWKAESLDNPVSEWVAAGVWSPETASGLEGEGLTPDIAIRINESRKHEEHVGGSAIYALCNGDLTVDEFRFRTCYRVMEFPEGCGQIYCGEFDSKDEAIVHAESDPNGTPESEWGSMRAAGNGQSPDQAAIEDEDFMPDDWYGESDWICVIPVKYDLA